MKNIFSFKYCLLLLPVLFLMCNTGNETSDDKDSICQVLSLADFKKELEKNSNPQLIDVRTPAEFSEGAIEGAKNIDFHGADFLEKMSSELDKNQTVFVYCKSGGRSGKTCKKLSENGFAKIYDLGGGYTEWSAQ